MTTTQALVEIWVKAGSDWREDGRTGCGDSESGPPFGGVGCKRAPRNGWSLPWNAGPGESVVNVGVLQHREENGAPWRSERGREQRDRKQTWSVGVLSPSGQCGSQGTGAGHRQCVRALRACR